MLCIFLLYIYRIHNNIAQKWIVAEKCLKIFDFLVKTYEIDPTDFMEQNKDEYAPPGFYILLKMNTNETSEFLK